VHAQPRLERCGIASRAQPAIVSRLIAAGRRVHAFIRAAARRDRNGIECGECQESSARRHEATFFEPQAEAIERAPQATEADRHPALGCQPITPIPRASRRAPHPGASATPAHGPRACGAGVRTAKSLVDVRNADPQQRGNLPHRHATIHRRRNPQAQVVRIRRPHCGPLGPNQTEPQESQILRSGNPLPIPLNRKPL